MTFNVCSPCFMDPNPHKNPGLLLAKVRAAIEPSLLAVGFQPGGGDWRGPRRTLFIDYGRAGGLFSLSWDQHEARLAAELLAGGGADHRVIAAVDFSGVRSTDDIETRLAPFLASVRCFLEGLREARP